jgi:sec-independent protein translocase protein TatB
MFDIGFLELLLLSVIGLLVLGPERLPKAARTIGAYVAKARRTWTNVRMDIEREIAAQEIKKHVQEPIEALKKDLASPAEDLDEFRRSTEEAFREPAKAADEQSRES